jgi:hypothetical protein
MPANGVIDSSAFNAGVKDPLDFLLTPPIAALRAVATQSLTTATWTALLFDVEDKDSVNGHSTSVNPSRYTAVYAGWYWCAGVGAFALSATGSRGVGWYVNGSAISAVASLMPSVAASFGTDLPAPGQLLFLDVSDYVELRVFQNTGGALSTSANSAMSIRLASL